MSVQPPNAYQSHDILDSSISKIQGEISFLQHNVGKRAEVQQTLLELAFARRADLALLQEPSVWLDRQGRWFTLQHPAYEVILQQTTTRPRTAIYVRKRASLRHRVCSDLSRDGYSISEISASLERQLSPFLLWTTSA